MAIGRHNGGGGDDEQTRGGLRGRGSRGWLGGPGRSRRREEKKEERREREREKREEMEEERRWRWRWRRRTVLGDVGSRSRDLAGEKGPEVAGTGRAEQGRSEKQCKRASA